MTASGLVSCSGSGYMSGCRECQSTEGQGFSCPHHTALADGTHGAGAMESAAGVLIKLFCVHTK